MVDIPRELGSSLLNLEDLFTKPSFDSFCHMASAGAICYKRRTINNLHDTVAKDFEDRKARSSYNWFFNRAEWSEDELAQRKAEMFLGALDLKQGDMVLLIIDDTYVEKKGRATDGVGSFKDHSKGFIWGNCFVTSVLQCKGLFIPHVAKMYLKEEYALKRGLKFKSKLEIALEDIIQPFKLPNDLRLMVVFDAWYFDADLIKKVCDLGYEVTCQLKSNKKILEQDTSLRIDEYAKRFAKGDFERIELVVRGKKKKYWALDRVVELEGVDSVRLVISKKRRNGKAKFYISTDLDRSASEILRVYEDRWNIETNHREANQKLGFKEYMLRGKKAIERFIQMVFAIWTLILIYDLEHLPPKKKRKSIVEVRTLSELIESVRTTAFIDMHKKVLKIFNIPIPAKENGVLKILRRMGLKT